MKSQAIQTFTMHHRRDIAAIDHPGTVIGANPTQMYALIASRPKLNPPLNLNHTFRHPLPAPQN